MQNLQTILLIIIPMLLGFLFNVPNQYLRYLDKILTILIYLIVLIIGIGLAQTQSLFAELGNIASYTITLFILLMLFNISILIAFDYRKPWQRSNIKKLSKQSISFLSGIKQITFMLLGIVAGKFLPQNLLPPEHASSYVIMVMIFIIGVQLRSSGIPLRTVLLNKRGTQISLLFIASCLLAGLVFSFIFKVSAGKGMALASGYGWGSLSGIMLTQSYGAIWGSVAVLNDLARELFALLFIPTLMRRSPSSAIGVAGATSLDFTLPIIQNAGGLVVIPTAISFGVITNLAAPLLMALCSSF